VLSIKRDEDVVAVDDVLSKLAAVHPEQAHLVELRFFGGMTMDEIAEATGTSKRTLHREWAVARAWLRRELGA
jgi:RNA polymerase sigma factor (sigma-70 family)